MRDVRNGLGSHPIFVQRICRGRQRLGVLFGVSPLPAAVGVGRRLRRVPDGRRRLRALKRVEIKVSRFGKSW